MNGDRVGKDGEREELEGLGSGSLRYWSHS